MTWHPKNLIDFTQYYPSSVHPCNDDLFNEYVSCFDSSESDCSEKPKIIIVKGFFADFMPGYMAKPIRYLTSLGFEVELAKTKSGGSCDENAKRLLEILPRNQDFLLLCHSKGGLDILRALQMGLNQTHLKGIIFSQTPLKASIVVDEILGFIPPRFPNWRHQLKNKLMLFATRVCGQINAARAISTESSIFRENLFRNTIIEAPFLSISTWSIKASSWVDSYHKRLSISRAGHAHDGQFFLDQQDWTGRSENLVLGGIDHAQPGMGGLGFDPGKYWLAAIKMILKRASS